MRKSSISKSDYSVYTIDKIETEDYDEGVAVNQVKIIEEIS
jgi:hypothetical protein